MIYVLFLFIQTNYSNIFISAFTKCNNLLIMIISIFLHFILKK